MPASWSRHLRPRLNRIVNVAAAALYAVSIVISCLGETWGYYLVGNTLEVLLLALVARTTWRWPDSAS